MMLKRVLVITSFLAVSIFPAGVIGGFEGININDDLNNIYKLYKKKVVYNNSIRGYVFYPDDKIENMSNVHCIDISVKRDFLRKKIKGLYIVFKKNNDEQILHYCIAHYGRFKKAVNVDGFTTLYEFENVQYDIHLRLSQDERMENVLMIKDKDFPYWWEMNIK
jgi:hypothetical protein